MPTATSTKRKPKAASSPKPASNGHKSSFKIVLMGMEGGEYVKAERKAETWEELLKSLQPFGQAFSKGLKEIIIVPK